MKPTDEAAWWNAGIAATALADWSTARRAWGAFGITLPPGEGEIIMNLGLVPIRIDPEGSAEVVWCRRIDPARAIIQNIPLPASGYRYGDLLLHDGAPNGTRILRGQEVLVFDALQLLHGSAYTTYIIQIQVGSEADAQALAQLVIEQEMEIEDWETIRQLCKACNEGNPGVYAGAASYADGQSIHLAIAALHDNALSSVLATWANAHPQSKIIDIEVLVPGARESLS